MSPAARSRRGRRLAAALLCGAVATAAGWAGTLVRVSRLWVLLVPGAWIGSVLRGAAWRLHHVANAAVRPYSFSLLLMLLCTLLFWTLATWLAAWLLGVPREEED